MPDTDTVPPSSAEELPRTAPPATPGADADEDVDARAGRGGSRVDVPALQVLLDGRYAEVRDLVRSNLAEYASILEEAEELPIDDFRERVKDVVVEMASTGQTGMGFPEEYGGGGGIGAPLAAFETPADGDPSVLVKGGGQFGPFCGAVPPPRTKHHHHPSPA